MKRWIGMALALAVLLAAHPGRTEAQVAFGPQAVLVDFDDLAVGGRVDFGLGQALGIEEGVFQELFASLNGNYVFTEGDATNLIFNANAAVPFEVEAPITPYAGAGINIYRWSISETIFGEPSSGSDTSSGLNLLGGLFFDLGEIPAFAELQYSTTGAGYISISFGVLFGG
jgi:opacity protein-like surface antigen